MKKENNGFLTMEEEIVLESLIFENSLDYNK